MEANVRRFEIDLNYGEVRHSLAEAMNIIENGVEEHLVPAELNTNIADEYTGKFDRAVEIQERQEQSPKKSFGLDYVAAEAIVGALGLLKMHLKRA